MSQNILEEIIALTQSLDMYIHDKGINHVDSTPEERLERDFDLFLSGTRW